MGSDKSQLGKKRISCVLWAETLAVVNVVAMPVSKAKIQKISICQKWEFHF